METILTYVVIYFCLVLIRLICSALFILAINHLFTVRKQQQIIVFLSHHVFIQMICWDPILMEVGKKLNFHLIDIPDEKNLANKVKAKSLMGVGMIGMEIVLWLPVVILAPFWWVTINIVIMPIQLGWNKFLSIINSPFGAIIILACLISLWLSIPWYVYLIIFMAIINFCPLLEELEDKQRYTEENNLAINNEKP